MQTFQRRQFCTHLELYRQSNSKLNGFGNDTSRVAKSVVTNPFFRSVFELCTHDIVRDPEIEFVADLTEKRRLRFARITRRCDEIAGKRRRKEVNIDLCDSLFTANQLEIDE